jgi:hypothetical protein
MSSTKASVVKKSKGSEDEKENLIRQRAYHKWLAATDGSPVSEEETQRFWLEAEQEVTGDE